MIESWELKKNNNYPIFRYFDIYRGSGAARGAVLATEPGRERDKKGTKFGDQGTHEYFF